mmetsp:Transcript_22312/g.32615  ORF Transcript_22312/g.32615 Transcript_22312/m.32615 type:complete len:291 (-) Transcript_22312:345-1217(-)
MKEQRRKAKLPLLAMKSKMYDNITMLDPSGQTLNKISKKKARWYISRNLATYEPNTSQQFIRLKFEPKARSTNSNYGKSEKKNVCVACGGEENQMRFYIVPYAYRQLFPRRYKSHISHDVVLLCASCHLRCGQQTQLRMNEIEERFHPVKSHTNDKDLFKIRSSGMALMHHRDKMPQERIKFHQQIVWEYFVQLGEVQDHNDDDDDGDMGGEGMDLSKEMLQRAVDIEYRVENPNHVSASELVVNSLNNDDEKMALFIREWRRFFLDTIHPRFLPEGWSVDYPVVSNLMD